MPSSQRVFGPFRLDPANACLWHGAEAVVLPPKAFDVLHYLVTHPDRLVTKDELLDAVWPETAVTDAVVRNAIGVLRKVLGDTAQTPRYIATVPRRGYRFLAPVAEHTEAAPGPTESVPSAVLQTPAVWPLGAAAPSLDTLAVHPHQGVAPLPGALPPPEAERRYLRGRGRRRRGGGTPGAPLALGETPNIAARLQHLAAPNTLVISAATYHLIEGYFTCEVLEEQPLRGRAGRVPVACGEFHHLSKPGEMLPITPLWGALP